jgi:hypothetical protein
MYILDDGLQVQFNSEFNHIPGDILKLLQEMNHEHSEHNGDPSADILQFIDCIECADPSAEDDEDNMNLSWGHSQFTSGGLTCSSVLVSWSAVGNISTAFRLLAAAVKTAKVARQLCFTQGISDMGRCLADAYIENIIELLWKCWNMVGIFLLSSPEFYSTALAPSFCARSWQWQC